ncbi:MAG: hypothetical protein K9L98_03640 [Candidatus Pacebacteria bacterium]|nr:hypothetical protein [Candidatus Paceibacterota bacterium]MCF7863070.1 hypothetical protein [Candidatus Paceibacterota bacterium]
MSDLEGVNNDPKPGDKMIKYVKHMKELNLKIRGEETHLKKLKEEIIPDPDKENELSLYYLKIKEAPSVTMARIDNLKEEIKKLKKEYNEECGNIPNVDFGNVDFGNVDFGIMMDRINNLKEGYNKEHGNIPNADE